MGLRAFVSAVWWVLSQPHGTVKSFEAEVERRGILGRRGGGMKIVPAEKIAGSGGRAPKLGSDLFYRTGKAVTRANPHGYAFPMRYRFERLRGMRDAEVRQLSRAQRADREAALAGGAAFDPHDRASLGALLRFALGPDADALPAPPRRGDGANGLTARQAEVLRLVAQGKTDRQIGAALVISEKTVGRHLEHIFARLGVSSRAAATAVAVRVGLA